MVGTARVIATAITAFLLLAALTASPAAADDDPIVVTPTNPSGRWEPPQVDIEVTDPGDGIGTGSSHSGGAGGAGAGPECTFRPEPQWEEFFRGIPTAIDGGEDQVDPEARLFSVTCGGVSQGFVWLGPGDPPDTTPTAPSPMELAQRAAAQLVLPVPVPRHSPDVRLAGGRSAVVVGEHTWIWIEPAGWSSRSKRVQAGAVWAEATATPMRLVFAPGDGGSAVTCEGPGTPYSTSAGLHAPSPDCGYVYPRPSVGRPRGTVTATYQVVWEVTWTGATGSVPAGGVLPEMTSQVSETFAVAEAQALITGSGAR